MGLVLLLLDIGRQLDAGDIQQRLQTVGVGLHQQDVAFAQHLVGRRHALALVAANQRDDLHIGFILHRADQRVQCAARVLAAFRHANFGEVGADLEQITVAFLLLAPGYQSPAEQGDEQHAGHRHRRAHRQKGEHAERRLAGFGAIAGDDQVGRRADQRQGAAEQRAERQRHQQVGWRTAALTRHPDRHRHEQRQRADVVHEARAQRDDPGERRHLRPGPLADLHQPARHAVHHAGIEQAAAEHQHRGHRNHRRMPQAGEYLLGRHHAGQRAGQQCREGDQVVAPAIPDKQHQRRRQHTKDDQLFAGHVLHLRSARTPRRIGAGVGAAKIMGTVIASARARRAAVPSHWGLRP